MSPSKLMTQESVHAKHKGGLSHLKTGWLEAFGTWPRFFRLRASSELLSATGTTRNPPTFQEECSVHKQVHLQDSLGALRFASKAMGVSPPRPPAIDDESQTKAIGFLDDGGIVFP